MIAFNHFNFNVLDMEKSLKFYNDALGLTVKSEKNDEKNGSYRIVYLTDGVTDFRLELTWLKDRTEPYDLGDEEFHVALVTDEYDEWHKKHEKMGCICFENEKMGIYFINDPDDYWLEIVPERR